MTGFKRVNAEDLDPDVRDTLAGYEMVLQQWGTAALDDKSDGLYLTALLDTAARFIAISAPEDFESRRNAAGVLLNELSDLYRKTLRDLQTARAQRAEGASAGTP